MGDQTLASNLTASTAVDHWYYLSNVDVITNSALLLEAGSIVIVGDSLTDGHGSTTNENNRWPDIFYRRRTTGGYLNQAAGGNRILNDGVGPSLLSRLDRDLLAQTGVRSMILFEGINDIIKAHATLEAQKGVTLKLIEAYEQIIDRLHAANLTVIGATTTPFGKNKAFAHPLREKTRQNVNNCIRNGVTTTSSSSLFDAVLDFDSVIKDPKEKAIIRAEYDSGDGLHLNPAGYKAIADSINLSPSSYRVSGLFAHHPHPPSIPSKQQMSA